MQKVILMKLQAGRFQCAMIVHTHIREVAAASGYLSFRGDVDSNISNQAGVLVGMRAWLAPRLLEHSAAHGRTPVKLVLVSDYRLAVSLCNNQYSLRQVEANQTALQVRYAFQDAITPCACFVARVAVRLCMPVLVYALKQSTASEIVVHGATTHYCCSYSAWQ